MQRERREAFPSCRRPVEIKLCAEVAASGSAPYKADGSTRGRPDIWNPFISTSARRRVRSRAQNLLAAQLKARRHFYIRGGRAATEMSSQGRSIIIKGQERRRRRGESAVGEGVTKLGRAWFICGRGGSSPTHLTLPDSRCSSSTSAPLLSPPLRSPIAIFPRCESEIARRWFSRSASNVHLVHLVPTADRRRQAVHFTSRPSVTSYLVLPQWIQLIVAPVLSKLQKEMAGFFF